MDELEVNVKKVIDEWLDKYDLRHYGYIVRDIEEVRVSE